MSETNFRHAVRDILKPGFVQQVENTVGPGTPDTYFTFEGVSGWIELKVGRIVPARQNTPVFKSLNRGLELEQEAWLYQCAHHGGNAYALLKMDGKTFLVPGLLSHSFNEMTWSEFEEYQMRFSDLRAILRFYAVGGSNDIHAAYKEQSPFERSVWYAPGRCNFRLRVVERFVP